MNKKAGMRFKESFGFKLLKAFIAVIFILSFVFTSYTVYHEYRRYKEDFLYNGEVLTGLLAHSSKIGIFSENKELLKDISHGILNHKDIITVSIYNADLKVLDIANKNFSRKQLNQAEGDLRRDITQRLITTQSLEVVETGNTFEFTRPVFMEIAPNIEEKLYFDYKGAAKTEKIIGYVKIVFDKDCLHKEMISILLRNAIMVLILILSSAAIIYIAVRRVTKPLERLTEGVRRLGMEENFEKISIESKDEIGRIASTFNEMAENLRKREKEKKLLEEHLAQAKKMETVGTLARGIAHDFNTILGIIKGNIYMLTKKIGDDSPLQKYILDINNSITRAKDLIQAMLVFSKTQKIYSAPVDVNTLIKEMNPIFSSAINENIEYIETLTDEPLIVMADRLKMEQVLTNIISNALYAMPEGGRLLIKTEVAHIEAEDFQKGTFKKPGRYALISISDTGTGMSKEIKERIYEPFFTTKEVGKGTGLGLSIVYGIIEEHKGYIDVETREEKGTSFKIYLPLASSDNAEVKP